jgi:hypothetical protein
MAVVLVFNHATSTISSRSALLVGGEYKKDTIHYVIEILTAAVLYDWKNKVVDGRAAIM